MPWFDFIDDLEVSKTCGNRQTIGKKHHLSYTEGRISNLDKVGVS
jgi:hypothetical protein